MPKDIFVHSQLGLDRAIHATVGSNMKIMVELRGDITVRDCVRDTQIVLYGTKKRIHSTLTVSGCCGVLSVDADEVVLKESSVLRTSNIYARQHSTWITAHDQSCLIACDTVSVTLYDKSSAILDDRSICRAYGCNTIIARGDTNVFANGESVVFAYDRAVVLADEKTIVFVLGDEVKVIRPHITEKKIANGDPYLISSYE